MKRHRPDQKNPQGAPAPSGCHCEEQGPQLLDFRGRPVAASSGPIGIQITRPFLSRARVEEAPGLPIGARIESARAPVDQPLGTTLSRAWQPSEIAHEPPARGSRGADLREEWEAGASVAEARAAEQADDAAREIPIGTRPSVEEQPSFQIPLNLQAFLPLFEQLPSDPAVREEAAQILGKVWGPLFPLIFQNVTAVPVEWRMDVVRYWGQVAALIPPEWQETALRLAMETELPKRVDVLRSLATLVIELSPQQYTDAIAAIKDQPVSDRLAILATWVNTHPRWFLPPLPSSAYTMIRPPPVLAPNPSPSP